MANDFTTDANCVALWRFESGALTTDDIGTNTLTNYDSTVDEDTVNYMEGECCADFERGDVAYLYIEEGDLDAGYPLKTGDTAMVISLAFWALPESDPTSSYRHVIYSNWNDLECKGFEVGIFANGGPKLYVSMGYLGNSETWFPATLSAGTKYHVGVAFDGVNKTCLIRVWDDTAETATSYTHTFSNGLVLGGYDLVIGNSARKISSHAYDGLVDELVVFNALRTATAFDMMRAADYSLPPTEGTADFFVPLPHMEADTTGTADFYVPMATIEAATLIGTTGTAECEVPKPQITANSYYTVGFASFEVPLAEVTALGGDHTVIEVPLVQVQAYGLTGTVGTAVLNVPPPGLTADSAAASLTVPLPQVIAAGLTGTIGTLSAEVPLVNIDATGIGETIGTASISVPIAQVYGEGSKDTYGTASVQVPLVKVSGSAFVGTIGTASITVPIPDIEALGYFDTTGTASITVPLASVVAFATEAVILILVDGTTESITSGYALVLNLKNNGLTEYDNYPFNSFTYFNGQYLGASSAGIYTLSGDDDNATDIDSKIQTGMSDEGTALRKGVEDAFLGLTAAGVMTSKVVTDGMVSYDGSPVTQRDDTLITERVKFGKGIRSRYLGLEVENSAGCDFLIESMELISIPLTRKL